MKLFTAVINSVLQSARVYFTATFTLVVYLQAGLGDYTLSEGLHSGKL
jgi:hypothetical protein